METLSPTVLLVEPSADEQEMYATAMRAAGLIPLAVNNPSAALRCASDVDLIVTADQLLGPIDGIDFVERLRRHEPTRPKPVIVLTGSAAGSTRSRAEVARCDVVLVKPCLPETLIHEIRQLIVRCHALREESDRILDRGHTLQAKSHALLARSESVRVGRGDGATRPSPAAAVRSTADRRLGIADRRAVRRGGRRGDDEAKPWWKG